MSGGIHEQSAARAGRLILLWILLCLTIHGVLANSAECAEIGTQGSSAPQPEVANPAAGTGATGLPEPAEPTATGEFSQTVRFVLPPFKGLEPKLALIYQSGSGNGAAGVGWHLDVPSIEVRTEGKGVANLGREVFVLDGKYLRPCTSLPAGKRVPGCTYPSGNPRHQSFFSEEDTGLRIVFDNGPWEGDPRNFNSGWIVFTQDGVRYDYRARKESKGSAVAYLLSTVTDPLGNQVLYHYTPAADPHRYLAGITYNGVKVTLFWEKRPDVLQAASGYMTLENLRYRVRTVLVEACTREESPEVVRAYTLTYALSGSTEESLLTGMQEFGADVVVDRRTGEILNPATATKKAPFLFEYQSAKDYPPPGPDPSRILPPGSVTAPSFFDSVPSMPGGDRFVDTGARGPNSLHPGLFFQGAQINSAAFPPNPWQYGEHVEHLKGDFNGDGADDHVIASILENKIDLTCFLAEDDSYRQFDCLGGGSPIATGASAFSGSVLVADMTGDGRADLVTLGREKHLLSFNDRTQRFDQMEIDVPAGGWRDVQTGCARGQAVAGDVNGDGLGDVVSAQDDGTYYVLNLGLSSGEERNYDLRQVKTQWFASPKDRVLLADVNGDGRKDVVVIGAAGAAEPPPLATPRYVPTCWRDYDKKGADPELPDSPPIKELKAPPNGSKLRICVALARFGPVVVHGAPLVDAGCYEDPNILWTPYAPAARRPPENETGGQWLAADVNGDGREDLVAIYAQSGSLSSHLTPFISMGTGKGMFRKQSGTDVPLAAGVSYYSSWSNLDIDGDHRADLVRFVDGFAFQTIFSRGLPGALDVKFDAHPILGAVPSFPFPSISKECWVGWPRGAMPKPCDNVGLRSADFAADGKGNYRVVAWGFDGAGEPKSSSGLPCTDRGSSNQACHHYDVVWRAEALALPTPNADPARWLPLDVDGDGYFDRVMITSRGREDLRIHLRLRNRAGLWETVGDSVLAGTAAYSPLAAKVGDFNGDGRQELAFVRSKPGANETAVLVAVFDRTSRKWKPLGAEHRSALFTTPDPGAWHVADQNGDGIDDLVYAWGQTILSAAGNSGVFWRTFLSDGKGRLSERAREGVAAGSRRFAFRFHPIDVDNDGADDLLSVFDVPVQQQILLLFSDRAGHYLPFSDVTGFGRELTHDPSLWAAVDANGDGAADLAYVAGTPDPGNPTELQQVWVDTLVSTGLHSFVFYGDSFLVAGGNPLGAHRLVDANGDGKTDVAVYSFIEDPGVLAADLDVTWFPLPLTDRPPRGTPRTGTVPQAVPFPVSANLASLDINRDTWDELEQLYLDGDKFKVNGVFQRSAYNHLSKIRNPLGGVTRITYHPLAEEDAAPEDRCVVPPFAAHVTSKVSTDSFDFGAGKFPVGSEREFRYACAGWSPGRRELHGFTTVFENERQALSDGTTAVFPNREPSKVTLTYDLSDACGARLLNRAVENVTTGARDEASNGYPALKPGEQPPFDCRFNSSGLKRREAASVLEIQSTVTYTRDEFGQVEWAEESGDAASPGDERTTRTVRTLDVDPKDGTSKGYLVTVAREEIFEGTKARAEKEPEKSRLRATYYCYDDAVVFDAARPKAVKLEKCSQSASRIRPQGLMTARLQCIDMKSGKCPSALASDYALGADVAGARVDYIAANTFTHDATGNIVESVDPRGGATTIVYNDPFPRSIYPSSVTDALGHQSILLWDWAKGLLREDREPERNVRAVYEYDALGRMTVRKMVVPGPMGDEDHEKTSFEYQLPDPPMPRQQFVKTLVEDHTADSRWSIQRLDGFGRVVRTESEASPSPETGAAVVAFRDTVYSDDSERPYIETDLYPSGGAPKAETFLYDYLGRLAEQRHAGHPKHAGARITTQYLIEAGAPKRLLERITDEALHVRTTAFDAYGRMARMDEAGKTAPAVVSARFNYNAAGDLVSTQGPAGDATTYEHDQLGRLLRQVDPDRGETLFSYDAGGNLTEAVDANKVKLTFAYDNVGRLITRTDSKTSRKLSFFYDSKDPSHGAGNAGWGMLDFVRDSAATGCPGAAMGLDPVSMSYAYDLAGNAVEVDKCLAGLSETTRESYDRFGRLVSVSYPDATPEVVSYEYDSGGHLARISNSAGTVYVSRMTFDVAGRLRGIDFGNGAQERYNYDPSWHLLQKETVRENGATGDLYSVEYGYTSDRLTESAKVAGSIYPAHTLEYRYDGQHRLEEKTGYRDESFQYDDLGNMSPRSGATYTYPTPGPGVKQIHAIASATLPAGMYSFSYDGAGNLKEIKEPGGTRTLGWDGNNRLQRVTFGTTDTSLSYDAFGERSEKTVAGGETRLYFSDAVEISRIGGVDKMVKYYFVGTRLIARRDGEGLTGPVSFYHRDRLGSTVAITDETGKKVGGSEYRYLAQGSLADARQPGKARDILFTAARHDFDTAPAGSGEELVYMGSRYYLPAFGLFVSADPIVPNLTTMGLNRYAYASGNPISRIDPSGNSDLPENPEYEGQQVSAGDGQHYLAFREGDELVWYSYDVSVIHEQAPPPAPQQSLPADYSSPTGFGFSAAAPASGRDSRAGSEILLVARSVGGRDGKLSPEGHAALILNTGTAKAPDHWIVQGGPTGSNPKQRALSGAAGQVGPQGWFHAFSAAKGANWSDAAATPTIPVTVLGQFWSPNSLSGSQLEALAARLNEKLSGVPYNYEKGPNSNSYVRLFLISLGITVNYTPAGMPLRGWAYDAPP